MGEHTTSTGTTPAPGEGEAGAARPGWGLAFGALVIVAALGIIGVGVVLGAGEDKTQQAAMVAFGLPGLVMAGATAALARVRGVGDSVLRWLSALQGAGLLTGSIGVAAALWP